MLRRNATERATSVALIESAVGKVLDPELRRPLADLGMVRAVRLARDGAVVIDIALTTAACPLRAELSTAVEAAALSAGGIEPQVRFATMAEHERRDISRVVAADRPAAGRPVAREIYAVGSGKGGVGKSSVAANLAVALAAQGRAVGLLDADVWGYSVPQLFGVRRHPISFHGTMLPIKAWGVSLMSTGFLVDDDAPIVWRGPMLHKALEQFISDVAWGDLDVLVLDLPPGTGDTPLSVLELLPDAGLIVVTTPQTAATGVARRVATMAHDARMPVVGVVENMSDASCPHCGASSQMFGIGGGEQLANSLGAPFLGHIPLDADMREAGDDGTPVVVRSPDAASSAAIRAMTERIRAPRRSVVGRPLPLSVVKDGARLA